MVSQPSQSGIRGQAASVVAVDGRRPGGCVSAEAVHIMSRRRWYMLCSCGVGGWSEVVDQFQASHIITKEQGIVDERWLPKALPSVKSGGWSVKNVKRERIGEMSQSVDVPCRCPHPRRP